MHQGAFCMKYFWESYGSQPFIPVFVKISEDFHMHHGPFRRQYFWDIVNNTDLDHSYLWVPRKDVPVMNCYEGFLCETIDKVIVLFFAPSYLQQKHPSRWNTIARFVNT